MSQGERKSDYEKERVVLNGKGMREEMVIWLVKAGVVKYVRLGGK